MIKQKNYYSEKIRKNSNWVYLVQCIVHSFSCAPTLPHISFIIGFIVTERKDRDVCVKNSIEFIEETGTLKQTYDYCFSDLDLGHSMVDFLSAVLIPSSIVHE